MLNDSWCRHDDSAVVRDITGYDTVSPYADIVANVNASDDFRPAAYEHVIADFGRALVLAAFEGVVQSLPISAPSEMNTPEIPCGNLGHEAMCDSIGIDALCMFRYLVYRNEYIMRVKRLLAGIFWRIDQNLASEKFPVRITLTTRRSLLIARPPASGHSYGNGQRATGNGQRATGKYSVEVRQCQQLLSWDISC